MTDETTPDGPQPSDVPPPPAVPAPPPAAAAPSAPASPAAPPPPPASPAAPPQPAATAPAPPSATPTPAAPTPPPPPPGAAAPAPGYSYPPPGYQQPGYQQPGYQQPGYQQPGAGGYPAAPGYGGQMYGTPTAPGEAPMTVSDERMWAMLAHLSFFVISIIGPLVVMLTMGKRSAYVKDQATEALNFQITFFIAFFVTIILGVVSFGILFFLPMVVFVIGLIFAIMAGMKSYAGEWYRYPMNIRMVR